MGVGSGLNIGGTAFGEFCKTTSEAVLPWVETVGKTVGKMTGNYDILNFVSGIEGMQQFAIKVPQWPIGGMYFDGILRTEHTSRVRPTQYPVQTGVVMTDHAIIEPAELTIEVMMNDTANEGMINSSALGNAIGFGAAKLLGNTGLGNAISKGLKVFELAKSIYSNFANLTASPDSVTQIGSGRSVNAWQALKAMQLDRIPIDVETRLQTYTNMIIEELSAPDDVKTLHALKCTVRLREIIIADVAVTKVSARPASTAGNSKTGATPVQTGGVADTAAAKIGKTIGGILR